MRNLVETYVDTGVDTEVGSPVEPSTPTRFVEDPLLEEKISRVDSKDGLPAQAEENLVLFPTYARVKPHIFHAIHQHSATSKHGIT